MTAFTSFSAFIASQSDTMSIEDFETLTKSLESAGKNFFGEVRKAAETAASAYFCRQDAEPLKRLARLINCCPDSSTKSAFARSFRAIGFSTLYDFGAKGGVFLTAHASQACVQLFSWKDKTGTHKCLAFPKTSSKIFSEARQGWTVLPKGSRIGVLEKAAFKDGFSAAQGLANIGKALARTDLNLAGNEALAKLLAPVKKELDKKAIKDLQASADKFKGKIEPYAAFCGNAEFEVVELQFVPKKQAKKSTKSTAKAAKTEAVATAKNLAVDTMVKAMDGAKSA